MLNWDDFLRNYVIITYYAQLGVITLTHTQTVVTSAWICVFNISKKINTPNGIVFTY